MRIILRISGVIMCLSVCAGTVGVVFNQESKVFQAMVLAPLMVFLVGSMCVACYLIITDKEL